MPYYLATYPETIVSVLNTGTFPNPLPPRLGNKHLICKKNVSDCLVKDISFHQTFLLQLAIPTERNSQDFIHIDPEEDADGILIPRVIKIEWIEKIIVYSQRGSNLLRNLSKNIFSKPIEVNPFMYPMQRATDSYAEASIHQQNQTGISLSANLKLAGKQQERSANKLEVNPPGKKLKVEHLSSSSSSSLPMLQAYQATLTNNKPSTSILDRMTSFEQHINLLQAALRDARWTLLITSYSISHETMFNANLYGLLKGAAERGVRIYIYFNDQKDVRDSVLDFFDQNGIFCDEAFTHSKILAVDSKFIAIGSFNWLSTIDDKKASCEEATIVYRGKSCKTIKEDLWKYIRYYRNDQFENDYRVDKFELDTKNESALSYSIENNSKLIYLPTLEQHRIFIKKSFSEAKQRLIICSPFISSTNVFEADINQTTLKSAIERNIEIYFICSKESQHLPNLRDFLTTVNYSNLNLITLDNFHLKTVIIDDDLIAEGSFNWLSASRDRDSVYHNHEVTLIAQGKMAKTLIDRFYHSKVGEALLRVFSEKIDSKSENNKSLIPQKASYQ